jgi:hypothetical protein
MASLHEVYCNAVLVLALLITLVAVAAVVLSLRKLPPFQAVTIATPLVEKKTESDSPKDESKEAKDGEKETEKDKDKDKDKKKETEKDKAELIDGAYKIVHQRWNRKANKYEDFDPDKEASQDNEGVVFIVYHRHSLNINPPTVAKELHVLSPALKEVLKTTLKHVDSVFDETPAVCIPLFYV